MFIHRLNFIGIWGEDTFLYKSTHLPKGSSFLNSASVLLITFRKISTGKLLYLSLTFMLTRREVLAQLKRIGIEAPSLRKIYFQDFEKYMEINYGLKIGQEKKIRVKNRDGPKLD
jgi:hypothetical protein